MLATTDNRREAMLAELEAGFLEWGVDVRLTGFSKTGAITIVALTNLDFILARVELTLRGLKAIRAV